MIGLLQRVSQAQVVVAGEEIAAIDNGLLVLVGIQRGDDEATARRLLQRIISFRVFADDDDKMNLSLRDTNGGLLLVPQFTLAADTRKGTRASFTSAAEPRIAANLFEYLLDQARLAHDNVASGRFGADMAVSLCNDGPVTFSLEVAPP